MTTRENFTEELSVSGGNILEGEKVLFKRLPKTITLTDEKEKQINLAEFRVFKFLEGEVIRVLSHGKLYIADSRNIKHVENLDVLGNITLPQVGMYFFFFSITGSIIFLGFDDGETGFKHATDITLLPEIARRDELFFDSITKVDDFVFETDQEVILLNDTESIRIVSVERNEIRGRSQTLTRRYLELRTVGLEKFFMFYPEMVDIATQIEEQLYSLAKYFHDIYMRMFIKNETTLKCTKDERTVLGIIHKLYTTTKQRTIPSRVNDVLASVHPTLLEKLLKKHTLPVSLPTY